MNEIIQFPDTQSTIAASRNYQESLKVWQGDSAYGKLAFLISSNMSAINNFAETMGKLIGEKAVAQKYDKQYFNPIYGNFKNFLSRNIYLSKTKREQMEKERYITGYAASFITESGIKLLTHGAGYWANKKDQFITFDELHQFLYSYASKDIKSTNKEQAIIELAKIRSAFPLEKSQKSKLCKKSQQSSNNLSDIISNSSFMSGDNIDLKISISYLLYAIHCQKFGEFYDDADALKNLMAYYNALGFHDNYAKELLRENIETYKNITNDQIIYLKLARNFVKNILIEIPNIDKDRLSEQAERMAKYDPYSIRRSKTQTVVKAGAQTIMGIYEKNPDRVVQSAATAIAQLDLEDNSPTAEFISDMFTKKGIASKDIDAIFESSECINCYVKDNAE